MVTKQQLRKRVAELGCTCLDCGDCLRLNAPAGNILAGVFVHSVDCYLDGETRPAAYASLLDDLEMGIERCDIEDCEICEKPMDPEEFKTLYRGEWL